MTRTQFITLILVGVLFSKAILAQDFLALAEQIKLSSPPSTIIKLAEDDPNPYFAIKMTSLASSSKGTALIFHDQGEHADWPGIINKLRTTLPNYGWDTLSVQFPTINDQPAEERARLLELYAKQLEILLSSETLKKYVVISHGENTRHVINVLPKNIDTPLAYVAISLALAREEEPGFTAIITQLNSPILDIYAQRDLPRVLDSAAQRAATIKQQMASSVNTGQLKYQQVVIATANHTFINQEDILVKRIAGWLKQNTTKQTITLDTENF